MKRALITGMTGQDASYLTELLLPHGYEVHGVQRRHSAEYDRWLEIAQQNYPGALSMHHADLSEAGSIARIIGDVEPDEVYHLAAQSHVGLSFKDPEYTADIVATGTLRVLQGVRTCIQRTGKEIRVYNAGSSEMFGASPAPQTEHTAFRPMSPYAVSKVAAHWHAVSYRQAYGMFICNGILFNHESPRRSAAFVTRKITRALTLARCGYSMPLVLGNIDAKRDWGFAQDYVQAMWLLLQRDVRDG